MGDFKTLTVWARAHALVVSIYRRTSAFPVDERYGLTSQLRRASMSIATNIAEGCGRQGDRELARFLRIARGSAAEVEYLLLLARDLGLLTEDQWTPLRKEVDEVSRMLIGLTRRLA